MAKKAVTIDDLAGMVKRGFDETSKDLGIVKKMSRGLKSI